MPTFRKTVTTSAAYARHLGRAASFYADQAQDVQHPRPPGGALPPPGTRTPPRDFADLPRSPGRRDFAALSRPRPPRCPTARTAGRDFGKTARPWTGGTSATRLDPSRRELPCPSDLDTQLLTFGNICISIALPTLSRSIAMCDKDPIPFYRRPIKESVEAELSSAEAGRPLVWQFDVISARETGFRLDKAAYDELQKDERLLHFGIASKVAALTVDGAASAVRAFNDSLQRVALQKRGFTIAISQETKFRTDRITTDFRLTVTRVA